MPYEKIFSPLSFRNLTIKNRILRSNLAGRFDNYDGTGAQARINWEVKFARAGVGAIVSSFVPVHPRGRILPNYATIVSDDRIPFWRALGKAVHEHDCKYILQLSHGGRQRDIPTIDYPRGLSSTAKSDPLHGFECDAMTLAQIKEAVQAFAEGARRAREAGLDGVELHGANGYLITQFLSSGINDRTDEYGGVLANRARFVREIVQAIRARVGRDFHLQMKISATEYNDAMLPDEQPGNTLEDSTQVCQWLKDDGVDAIVVSSGSSFPHPKNPAGDLPIEELQKDLRQPGVERPARRCVTTCCSPASSPASCSSAGGRRRAGRRIGLKDSIFRTPGRSSALSAPFPCCAPVDSRPRSSSSRRSRAVIATR